jgi:hypothetical protein
LSFAGKITNLHKCSFTYFTAPLIAVSLAGMNNSNMADVQTGFVVHLVAMIDDSLDLVK